MDPQHSVLSLCRAALFLDGSIGANRQADPASGAEHGVDIDTIVDFVMNQCRAFKMLQAESATVTVLADFYRYEWIGRHTFAPV